MKHYVGEVSINSFGTPMKIVEIIDRNRIVVEFQDEYMFRKETTIPNFSKHSVLNPYDRTVYGVGYVGYGKYKVSENKRSTKIYDAWNSMIRRCYCGKNLYDKKSYYGVCEVCSEWKNFQNYAQWYEENYYIVEGERMHVDKDILHTGNKLYSPENCLIVPQSINVLFVNKFNEGLLKGISKCKNGTYRVEYKRKLIGNADRLEEAMIMYGKARKDNIIKVANKLKDKLPLSVYRSVCSWNEKSMLELI